jgi:hypothetical protein
LSDIVIGGARRARTGYELDQIALGKQSIIHEQRIAAPGVPGTTRRRSGDVADVGTRRGDELVRFIAFILAILYLWTVVMDDEQLIIAILACTILILDAIDRINVKVKITRGLED